MPAIDFRTIRSHRGSQHSAFEELVSQLAALETPAGTPFHRKGVGADAGVECYRVDADGSETAWQAKYFFEFGNSQAQQLTESFDQAVASHPRLNRYIVSVPFDFSDGRVGKQKSQKDRWDDWVAARAAAIAPRQIEIVPWSAFELTERLSRNTPLYVGRRTYWFDAVHFGNDWFESRFAITRAALGKRYTPELNVDLPIRQALTAFARDPAFLRKVERWADQIDETAHSTLDHMRRALADGDVSLVSTLEDQLHAVSRAIRTTSLDTLDTLPFEDWATMLDATRETLGTCAAKIWDLRISPSGDNNDIRHGVYFADKLHEVIGEIEEEISSPENRCGNPRRLLLTGAAGVGKSHLLADVAKHHIAQGFPALLVLGGSFSDAEPWRQIADLIGLTTTTPAEILGALDAAAEAAGTRALVMVDAINERQGIAVWSERLAAFLETATAYPRIGILVSCRTTFLPYVVSDHLDEAALPRIAHPGFAGRAAEAARRYLDQRGIVRMAAPHLAPEFENPLFLRTCCDLLDLTGEREFPRGLAGISSIFEFYFRAIATTLNHKMGLFSRSAIVEGALQTLTNAMVEAGSGYLPLHQVLTLLEAIHPSQGRHEQSLFFQFENEGVLAVEPVNENGVLIELVRFTFERLSDHRIAERLLDEKVGSGDPALAFATDGPLRGYIIGQDAHRFAGVAEAFAVQIPERYARELPDLIEDEWERWSVAHAFQQSLLWRNQAVFTERTLKLVEDLSEGNQSDPLLSILLAVATEPDNPFNADHLDRKLHPMTLAERDVEWSTAATGIADEPDSPITTLIEWTMSNGLEALEPERARLVALTLGWLTSLSHRHVRDMATKALAALFVTRRVLVVQMVRHFADVDDPYVVDRVLAAAYGGATRSYSDDGLAELARAAFAAVFDRSPMPLHALIRDHARGLVELAAARGVLPADLDLVRARPPYGPGVPLEEISDETLAAFVEDYGGTKLRDEICSSAIEDGDFARYEIDPLAGRFLLLPREDVGRPLDDIYEEWRASVIAPFPERVAALDRLVTTVKDLRDNPLGFDFLDRPARPARPGKRDARKTAESEHKLALAAFEALLDEAGQQEFRIRGFGYVERAMWDPDSFGSHPDHTGMGARRWVAWRAHDLGWTPERFSAFDRHVHNHGRMEHRIERIGKKYQWIALHELTGRLSDYYAVDGNWRYPPQPYEGPWQVGMREMDPTVLVTHTEQRDNDRQGATWWSPLAVRWWHDPPPARIAWMSDRQRDMPDPVREIDVTDPEGRRWLVLDANVGRNQWVVIDGERVIHRMTWHKVKSLLVSTADADRLERLLVRDAGDRDHPPETDVSSGMYLGEYRWHPSAASSRGDWKIGKRSPIGVMTTIGDWYIERSGHDYSIQNSFNLTVPSPALMDGLGLRLAEGRSLLYADAGGTILFKDPSAEEPGFSAAVVDRAAMLACLEREDLELVWSFSGEKSAHGGKRHSNGWGGMLEYWGIYRLRGDQICGKLRFEEKSPRGEQLAQFLASG
ncbi:ATP-binding protein [Qipengyuania atrilutea]|uniref:ATP-binding protein n=1 Tax=Qipengyuania atrilutea TaxID=2744473 RepID=A0A850H647_9SPHN|nr:ATP-binding protein [Actirhodobacter atriluteus]NVD45328.1 ATP-binding protein [Actirhodobacter atriluteus]